MLSIPLFIECSVAFSSRFSERLEDNKLKNKEFIKEEREVIIKWHINGEAKSLTSTLSL